MDGFVGRETPKTKVQCPRDETIDWNGWREIGDDDPG
jgi:hypothetical protein